MAQHRVDLLSRERLRAATLPATRNVDQLDDVSAEEIAGHRSTYRPIETRVQLAQRVGAQLVTQSSQPPLHVASRQFPELLRPQPRDLGAADDDAMTLGVTAARWLQENSDQDDPESLSLAGMPYLRTAVAAARRQDRGSTTDLLRQAASAAGALGRDGNYWKTGFGPTNVRLHEVSAGLDMGDVASAVEQGRNVDASRMPTERATAHRIDMGRALSYVARDDEALEELLAAEKWRRNSSGTASLSGRRSGPCTAGHQLPLRRAPSCAGWLSGAEPFNDRCRDRRQRRRWDRGPLHRPGRAAARSRTHSRGHPHPDRRDLPRRP